MLDRVRANEGDGVGGRGIASEFDPLRATGL